MARGHVYLAHGLGVFAWGRTDDARGEGGGGEVQDMVGGWGGGLTPHVLVLAERGGGPTPPLCSCSLLG